MVILDTVAKCRVQTVQDSSQLVWDIWADDCCPVCHSLLGMNGSGMANIGCQEEVGGPQVSFVHFQFRKQKDWDYLRFPSLYELFHNLKLLMEMGETHVFQNVAF